MIADKGKLLICDNCGAAVSLEADHAVAAAQIIVFVDAHRRRPGTTALRIKIGLPT